MVDNLTKQKEKMAKLGGWLKSQGVPEDQIMNKGRSKQDGWIHNAGDQVHFRTPIDGTDQKGL